MLSYIYVNELTDLALADFIIIFGAICTLNVTFVMLLLSLITSEYFTTPSCNSWKQKPFSAVIWIFMNHQSSTLFIIMKEKCGRWTAGLVSVWPEFGFGRAEDAVVVIQVWAAVTRVVNLQTVIQEVQVLLSLLTLTHRVWVQNL